ncbi:DMT family transporter [Photobacterium leiognathi]|uniref:DMT family transporter n=1 Tax=Photobacterium leiognathi TaxID=553611 RepID=UPI002732C383|nr:DMT family transporter [Photobacterium leiognathi]
MEHVEQHKVGSLNKSSIAIIGVLAAAVFWGTSFGVAKEAMLYTGVLMFLVIRFCCTLVVIYPLVAKKINWKVWRQIAPTGAILSIIYLAETYGLKHTTASNAAFLISLFIIFTPGVDALINRHKIAVTDLFAGVIAIVGVWLLVGDSLNTVDFNIGNILILIAALGRAAFVVTTKKKMDTQPSDPMVVTFIQLSVVTLVCIFLLILTVPSEQYVLPNAMNFWLYIGYLVVFCTLFAFYIQNYGVKHTSPTQVSFLLGLEPVFGGLFAHWWLGERFDSIQWIGAGLIVFAAMFISLKFSFRRRMKTSHVAEIEKPIG